MPVGNEEGVEVHHRRQGFGLGAELGVQNFLELGRGFGFQPSPPSQGPGPLPEGHTLVPSDQVEAHHAPNRLLEVGRVGFITRRSHHLAPPAHHRLPIATSHAAAVAAHGVEDRKGLGPDFIHGVLDQTIDFIVRGHP